MKQKFLNFLFTLCCCLTLVACSSDDDEMSDDFLIGKWKMVNLVCFSEENGKRESFSCDPDKNGDFHIPVLNDKKGLTFSGAYFIFKKDHSTYYYRTGEKKEKFYNYWMIKGNNLYFYNIKGHPESTDQGGDIYKRVGDKLVANSTTTEVSSDGGKIVSGFTYTFKKVK